MQGNMSTTAVPLKSSLSGTFTTYKTSIKDLVYNRLVRVAIQYIPKRCDKENILNLEMDTLDELITGKK
jgi:hypothetical protein